MENKFGRPYEMKPSIRLTFATNTLPRITDGSKGMWRRMLLLEFKQAFGPEQQDRRLVDAQHWQLSGELPGIFNWAIEGLARLRNRGRFVLPRTSAAALKRYEDESNWLATWLRDNYEVGFGTSVYVDALMSAQQDAAHRLGCQRFGSRKLNEAIRAVFPGVEQSENALHRAPRDRQRAWVGLKQRADHADTMHSKAATFGTN